MEDDSSLKKKMNWLTALYAVTCDSAVLQQGEKGAELLIKGCQKESQFPNRNKGSF